MNNIKKTGLGLMAAVLAFGFSAFTTPKATNQYRYYKVSTGFGETDVRGYKYYEGDKCIHGLNVCSVVWDIGTSNPIPSDGYDLPADATYIPNTTLMGAFEY